MMLQKSARFLVLGNYNLLSGENHLFIQTANGSKFHKKPLDFSKVAGPYGERKRLKPVEKQPAFVAEKPRKQPRRYADFRGPEEVHNTLVHKQFGIQATQGGQMKYGHFNVILRSINYHLDEKRMFAVWRIDPPWKPVTKKPLGARMGGGKAAIDHYVTPVKAGRILIELGGECEWEEVQHFLKISARLMPFDARPVSHRILEEERAREKFIEKNNLNPFTFEYLARNNMRGCHSWLTKYDWQWFGKFR